MLYDRQDSRFMIIISLKNNTLFNGGASGRVPTVKGQQVDKYNTTSVWVVAATVQSLQPS